MDIQDFRTVTTVLALLTFVGIVVYAYSSKRQHHFEEIGRAVLNDDEGYAHPHSSAPLTVQPQGSLHQEKSHG